MGHFQQLCNKLPEGNHIYQPLIIHSSTIIMVNMNHGSITYYGNQHRSLNVPIEHHPTIRYMVYNGYYKVMSNIPKMGHLPIPDQPWINHRSIATSPVLPGAFGWSTGRDRRTGAGAGSEFWISKKKNRWKPMEIPGISWIKPWKSHENLWKTMKNHDKPMENPWKSNEKLWKTMKKLENTRGSWEKSG